MQRDRGFQGNISNFNGGFLLCLITILGFLGLKGWKYWLLALAMAHGCSFCSFSPISPGERTGWFGTQVPRSIKWYLSSSEEFPVVRCHRTLWYGHGSVIAFIIGIHRMCTPTNWQLGFPMVNKNDHCESTQLQLLQHLSHTGATLPMPTIDPSLMQRSDTKNWEATLLQRPNCFGISQILWPKDTS